MQKFPHDISEIKKESKVLLIIFAILLAAVWLYFYNTSYYVIVRFDELGSITKNMSAYYNGFKIGKITKINPDKDFKHMVARINLYYKDMNLPQNTTVKVEAFPNGELYLEFVYPPSPSLKTIKRGDILEGIAKYSLEEFMLGQNVSGVSDIVSIHVLKALNAMDLANKEMEQFFKVTSKVVEENKKGISLSVDNIVLMTDSFAQMAENLNKASKKLNNSMDEKDLKKTTSNIKDTTDNIAKATKDIDKTVKKIDDTITQVNAVSENLNVITCGVKETLAKRFGGMRIMFGTPVKQQNCCRNACK